MLQLLLDRGGYIGSNELDEMIDLFGNEFPVVVKFNIRDREFMPLIKLKTLDKETDEDIREVFLSSDQYRALQTYMEEFNDERHIIKLLIGYSERLCSAI